MAEPSWTAAPVALVGVFPPPQGGQAVFNARLVEEVRARGIGIRPVRVGGDSPPAVATRRDLVRTLLREEFSLVHLTASDTRVGGWEVLVAAVSAVKRIPFVYTILAGAFPRRVASSSPLRRVLVGLALRRASVVWVCNSSMRDALARLPFLRGIPLEVMGCRLPLGEEPRAQPEITEFLRGGSPSVVTVGALRPVYALDVLIKACGVLAEAGHRPRVLAIVSGQEDPLARQALEEALRDARGVEFMMLQNVPRPAVLGALAEASVVARPTRADGDSLTVHEALTLGKPVVASDAVPRPSGVTLHRVDDPHSLASALLRAQPPTEVPAEETSVVERVVLVYERLARR